jgi:hypothetical protein
MTMAQTAKKALVNKVMDMTEAQCNKIMPMMSGMMTGGMMTKGVMDKGESGGNGLTAGQKKLPPALQKAILKKK